MKRKDLLAVLEATHSQGEASRKGLAEKLGFAPSYIGTLVAELRHRGLVEEGGRSPSRAGRRRIMLHVVPDLAHVIGIRIGRANTRIVVSDLRGNVLSLKKLPTEIRKGEQHVFDLLDREIGSIICAALRDSGTQSVGSLAARSEALCEKRPLYPGFRGFTTYAT